MSPLFKIGESRLADLASTCASAQVAPNVLTFTTDKATRKREAKRLADWRRESLARMLAA
jgi:hypothetical protein